MEHVASTKTAGLFLLAGLVLIWFLCRIVYLNRRQRKTLYLGYALLSVMLMFPPWGGKSSAMARRFGGEMRAPVIYAPRWSPPRSYSEIDDIHIRFQLCVLVTVTGGLVFLLRDGRETKTERAAKWQRITEIERKEAASKTKLVELEEDYDWGSKYDDKRG